MSDKELIKQEIERLKHNTPNAYDLSRFMLLEEIESFINSLPEESGCEVNFTTKSDDLEREIGRYTTNCLLGKRNHSTGVYHLTQRNCDDIARHFAEWQKQKDEKLFKEDTWNYIEEQYPDVIKEEKLRLYDISIKSRLAGANAIKQQMKEVLQTEYEKGRFDKQQEMMKDSFFGVVSKRLGRAWIDTEEDFDNWLLKFDDLTKVKIIIIKQD